MVYILHMNKAEIIRFMKAHHGYAQTTDILDEGFSFRDIKTHLEKGDIEKVKCGLYRL